MSQLIEAVKSSEKPCVRAPLRKVWEYKVGDHVRHEALAGDLVVFASEDKSVRALDVGSGGEVWKLELDAKIHAHPSYFVVTDGVIFALGEDNVFYVIDADTGEKLWQLPTEKGIAGSPVLAEGVVYIIDLKKKGWRKKVRILRAIDVQTGQEYWSYSTTKDILGPAVGAGKVFFLVENRQLYALDAKSGETAWKIETRHEKHSAPAVADGKVLVYGEEGLYAFDAGSGRSMWKFEDFGVSGPYGEPLVLGNHVVSGAELTFISLDTGVAEKKLLPGQSYPITIRDNQIYSRVGGALFSLDKATGEIKWFAVIETEWPHNFAWVKSRDFVFATAFSSHKLYGINLSKFTKRWVLDKYVSRPLLSGDMAILSIIDPSGHSIAGYTSSEEPGAIEQLEIGEEIAPEPRFVASMYPSKGGFMGGDVEIMWPNCCCMCCGPVGKRVNVSEAKDRVSLSVSVPYCEECLKKTKVFLHKEEPGVKILKTAPPVFAFRNERYWAMFMEANHLR